jgi:hypothetical protein
MELYKKVLWFCGGLVAMSLLFSVIGRLFFTGLALDFAAEEDSLYSLILPSVFLIGIVWLFIAMRKHRRK